MAQQYHQGGGSGGHNNNNRRQYAPVSTSSVPTSSYSSSSNKGCGNGAGGGGVQLSANVFRDQGYSNSEQVHTFDVKRYSKEGAPTMDDNDYVPTMVFWGAVAVVTLGVIGSLSAGSLAIADMNPTLTNFTNTDGRLIGTPAVSKLPAGVTKLSVEGATYATTVVINEQIMLMTTTVFELIMLLVYIVFGGFIMSSFCVIKSRSMPEKLFMGVLAALVITSIGLSAHLHMNMPYWRSHCYKIDDTTWMTANPALPSTATAAEITTYNLTPAAAAYKQQKATDEWLDAKAKSWTDYVIVQVAMHTIVAVPLMATVFNIYTEGMYTKTWTNQP